MRTSKPFATISYNTDDFLIVKLDELVTKRLLSWYCFVNHFAEEDETKDHKHLFFYPNGQVDTDSIIDFLEELDPTNVKPLRCLPCRSSKFDDWFLYSAHDTDYLATKLQFRKYHYDVSEFISSDSDFLHELICTIDRSKYIKSKYFFDSIVNGKSLIDLVSTGNVPVSQFNQFASFYTFVTDSLYRNGRVSHSPLTSDATSDSTSDSTSDVIFDASSSETSDSDFDSSDYDFITFDEYLSDLS